MTFVDSPFLFLVEFTDPAKRIFVGYILLAFAIGFVWLVAVKKMKARGALAKIFDRKVYFSKSSKADYTLLMINQVIALLVSPLLITHVVISAIIFSILSETQFVQGSYFENVGGIYAVLAFSLALFVMDDFTRYVLHRWMHHWPILWAIHKVHHSARTLTPVTIYRIHPLEGILFAFRSAVSQGAVIPVFVFLFGESINLYTVLGANVFIFVTHVTGSNLRHTNIDLYYWRWLEYIFISPAQHQLHHSTAKEHHDKNFGGALAIWDWLFGSLHFSERDKTLQYGLGKTEKAAESSLRGIYFQPLVEISQILKRKLKRRTPPLHGSDTSAVQRPDPKTKVA